MFKIFDDLSKAVRGVVDFSGDAVSASVSMVTRLPVDLATVVADATLGEKNVVSQSLDSLHGGVCHVTDLAMNYVAKPVAGAIATVPIRKLGAAARVVGGMGQVAFTENSREGLQNIREGAGSLAVMAVTGALLTGVAEGISESCDA